MNSENLRRIVDGQDTSGRDVIIGNGVDIAMGFREHRAAIRTSHGVGLIQVHTDLPNDDQRSWWGVSGIGISAALITDTGKILVERHNAVGMIPEQLDGSLCRAFTYTVDDGLNTVDGFDASPTSWSEAYRFEEILRETVGKRVIHGVVDSVTDSRAIVLELIQKYNHSFANPLIDELVYTALREEL